MKFLCHIFIATTGQLPPIVLTLFTALTVICSAETKQTRWPLHSQKPVLFVWNAPTQECGTRHHVTVPLNLFDITSTPTYGFVRQNLTLFYVERLGIYPYYNREETPVNGGLPQVVSLTRHYEKIPNDLDKFLPDPQAQGLAVIDWEEWRPLWIRNWGDKDIYRRKSRDLIRSKHQNWTPEELEKVSQQEYELSAKKLMLETLRMGKSLRPNQLWGFYLFPDCYNHDYQDGLKNYTGHCPAVELSRNDQLNWLWVESSALFPSIYLDPSLSNTKHGRLFVRNRVKEAMRLSSVGNGLARPVFVYTQPTYNLQMTVLTETDLVSTIGESVALGVAGVIFWGNSSYASSVGCTTLSTYLAGSLGHYLLNATTAAKECSKLLCSFHGRCLRRKPDSDVYLHLSPSTHRIQTQNDRLKVSGEAGEAEKTFFQTHFQCQCYSGHGGESCEQRRRNRASSVLGMWPLYFLLPLLFLLH